MHLPLSTANGNAVVIPPPCNMGWINRETPGQQETTKIRFSPQWGAVAMSRQGDFLRSTDDGVSWLEETGSGGASDLMGLEFSPELNLFVAGAEGPTALVLTSSGGGPWTPTNTPLRASAILWIPAPVSVFVAVCRQSCPLEQAAMTSLDGVSWQLHSTPSTGGTTLQWRGLAYSPSLQRVVAVSTDAHLSQGVMISDDYGESWELQSSPPGGWVDVQWAEELHRFVAVSLTGNHTMDSADGIHWHLRSNPTRVAHSLVWSPEVMLMVAPIFSSSSGTHIATHSRDGKQWRALRENPTAPSWRQFTSIQYVGGSAGRFLAAGTNSPPFAVMTYDSKCFPLQGSPAFPVGLELDLICMWH